MHESTRNGESHHEKHFVWLLTENYLYSTEWSSFEFLQIIHHTIGRECMNFVRFINLIILLNWIQRIINFFLEHIQQTLLWSSWAVTEPGFDLLNCVYCNINRGPSNHNWLSLVVYPIIYRHTSHINTSLK